MKKQNIWIFVTLTTFFWVGVCGAVESASRYKTMYGTGYKNMYNPEDWGATHPSKLRLGTNAPGSRLFRYYIPPAVNGTVTLALFVPQSQMIGAVARLGFPPQCDSYSTSTSVSESSFYGLPWDERDATLAQLRANDVRIRNYTGTISLVTDEVYSSPGEWLYVKVIFDGNGSHVHMTNFEVGIDSDEYAAWHGNTATWDSNGDPLPNGQTFPVNPGNCPNFNPAGGDDPPVPPDPVPPDPVPPFPPVPPTPSPIDPVLHLLLKWDASVDVNLAGYYLYRAERIGDHTTAWGRVATIGKDVITYTDKIDNKNYAWMVTAFDMAGNESFPSNMVEKYDKPSLISVIPVQNLRK